MSEQRARCRGCGRESRVIEELDENGDSRFIAPAFCPNCGQAFYYDVLGPAQPVAVGLDTGDLDTKPLSPVIPEATPVPVIRVTSPAYSEAHRGGLDLRDVRPTGADGVITVSDVYEALANASQEVPANG